MFNWFLITLGWLFTILALVFPPLNGIGAGIFIAVLAIMVRDLYDYCG